MLLYRGRTVRCPTASRLGRRLAMSDRAISDLIEEVKNTRSQLAAADGERLLKLAGKVDRVELDRLGADVARKMVQLETAIESLSRKANRPGAGGVDVGAQTLRESARG